MTLEKKTLKSQTVRSSGVELLKVFAILAICLSHCTQTMEEFVNFQEPTCNIQLLILRFFRFNGNIGNLVFVISSSYFLLGKKVKHEKILNLLFDSQFISVIILSVFCVLSIIIHFRVNFSFDELFLRNIFPDIYENVWFIPAYVILYFIHPAIDSVIDGLDRRKHLAVCLLLFAFFSLCSLLNCSFGLSNLGKFVIIYLFIAYIKLYRKECITDRKKNIKIFLISSCLLVVCVLIKNFLGLRFSFFEKYPNYNDLTSFILFPMVLSLFNVFLTFDFKSKAINYISSCSLFVYCIHENLLVREEIRPKFYEFMIEKSGGVNHCLLNVMILFVAIALFSFAAAIIYKHTLHILTAKLSIKADNLICKTLYKTTSIFIKE